MSNKFNDYLDEMCRVYTDDAVRASCKSTCQSAVDDEQLDKIDRCFGTFSNIKQNGVFRISELDCSICNKEHRISLYVLVKGKADSFD